MNPAFYIQAAVEPSRRSHTRVNNHGFYTSDVEADDRNVNKSCSCEFRYYLSYSYRFLKQLQNKQNIF